MGRAVSDRYLIVPCEASGCGDLAVIWDRLEEQVIDVIDAGSFTRYSDEDALWDDHHAPAASTGDYQLAA